MADKCAMYVQTFDNMVIREGFESFTAMKSEAHSNQDDRVLYWWCELEELEARLHE